MLRRGALPHAVLHADHDGGPVEALDDAGGDDADDAGVPALGVEDEAGVPGTRPRPGRAPR